MRLVWSNRHLTLALKLGSRNWGTIGDVVSRRLLLIPGSFFVPSWGWVDLGVYVTCWIHLVVKLNTLRPLTFQEYHSLRFLVQLNACLSVNKECQLLEASNTWWPATINKISGFGVKFNKISGSVWSWAVSLSLTKEYQFQGDSNTWPTGTFQEIHSICDLYWKDETIGVCVALRDPL